MSRSLRLLISIFVFAALFLGSRNVAAQTETATVRGTITDRTGAFVPDVVVRLIDVNKGTKSETIANASGMYTFANVVPGQYRMEVEKSGFKLIHLTGITANVQDNLEENFQLEVGAVSESVTVEASAYTVNLTDATVATVVDRQFVENIPMNGRSFQTLIMLTPGMVVPAVDGNGTNVGGQFATNGQRTSANGFTVDGVNANFAASPGFFNTYQTTGNLPGLSVLGTTQTLASVDAVQEFKVQTSSYAAEFGPQPGAQISIVTRSGTNKFHGSVFDYLRNDRFDANDWFLDRQGAAKPSERQNDFGGTLGGPLVIPRVYDGKNRTFFFFSYEGLRLRLPTFTLANVPNLCTRGLGSCGAGQSPAAAAVQPILNAFPLPTGRDLGNGWAEMLAVYSNSATIDTASIRVDHTFTGKINGFLRYNWSPSESLTRSIQDPGVYNRQNLHTWTITGGLTAALTDRTSNEFRVNYSSNGAFQISVQDGYGGAKPIARDQLIPSAYDSPTAGAVVGFATLPGTPGFNATGFPNLNPFTNIVSSQHTFNISDNFSYALGSHRLKFGFTYRRLTPVVQNNTYFAFVSFTIPAQLISATAGTVLVQSALPTFPILDQYAAFAQDTWRISRRLSLDYGVRWDVIPAPGEANGNVSASLTEITDLSKTDVAPLGTKQWATTYGNFAPRAGFAYQLFRHPHHETVLRGGFGIFYDTATDQATQNEGRFPYTAIRVIPNVPFPLPSATVAPISVPARLAGPYSTAQFWFDPHLKLPYTWQWNLSVEQSLGTNQSLTVSYVGAAGRRLLHSNSIDLRTVYSNPNFPGLNVTVNQDVSNYDALQTKFQRRLSHGLQALVSHTWSHSLDSDSMTGTGRIPLYGNAQFDVRHVFGAAGTYDIPSIGSPLGRAIFGHWSADTSFHAQTGTPVDIAVCCLTNPFNGSSVAVRPDLNPGVPVYLDDPNVPGGMRINRAAFTAAPTGQNGNLGRNVVRGFGAWQQDFGLRREFPLRGEGLKLQFRAEAFNIFNHPNFGTISTGLTSTTFGLATNMLGRQLSGLNALYQIGGPRSLQFALKLLF